MNKIKSNMGTILMIISGLIMIGSIKIWAPVCSEPLELFRANGDVKYMSMKCVHNSKLLMYLSIILIVVGLFSFIKNKKQIVLPIVIGILMMISVSHDYGIGMCKTGIGMECEATRLWINIVGALSIISGLVSAFLVKKTNQQ